MVCPMGFLDKAKDMLGKHDDKVDQALDRVGEQAKQRFAGHDQHIDKAVDMAQQRTGDGDTTQAPMQEGQEQAPPVAAGQPGETVPGEPQSSQPGDPAGGYDQAQEVPGGPETDVPAGPGHNPPQQ